MKEFIAYAKGNAEKLNVGHAGIGSLIFTYALLLNSLLGVKPTMVPFTGAAPAANALIGGQIDYMLNGISDVGQRFRPGQSRLTQLRRLNVTRPCPMFRQHWRLAYRSF